jgi:acetoin:2,6-dichlorophenolindophenol oxidoreductase subunit alpha
LSPSLSEMLRRMLLIRTIEERLRALGRESKAPITSHSGGQEAAGIGVIDALGPDDLLLTNHRSMSHLLARGADPKRVLAEVYGKRTGYCKGKSGYRHISIRELGIILTSTIVGAELSLAPGVGLGMSMKDTQGIVACFFGEGAACEGTFHESLNLASVWQLPILYACENNQWQGLVRSKDVMANPRVSELAATYRIQSMTVDGRDIEAVREAAQKAVAYVRKERKPFLLETDMYRLRGHNSVDPQSYVDPKELAVEWARDPIVLLTKRLAESGLLSEEARAQMQRDVDAEVDAALAFAFESPYPGPEDLLKDVYA